MPYGGRVSSLPPVAAPRRTPASRLGRSVAAPGNGSGGWLLVLFSTATSRFRRSVDAQPGGYRADTGIRSTSAVLPRGKRPMTAKARRRMRDRSPAASAEQVQEFKHPGLLGIEPGAMSGFCPRRVAPALRRAAPGPAGANRAGRFGLSANPALCTIYRRRQHHLVRTRCRVSGPRRRSDGQRGDSARN